MKVRNQREKEAILAEAKERYQRVDAWEAKARGLFLQDLKFAEGDSDNNWQWPDEIRQPRETDERPMLTINKTRQHNLNVLNDARQSKVAVKIIPIGDEATYESAQAFMATVRAIEYRSDADSAYQMGLAFAVKAGIGYWRVLTDYVDADTFDQELLIKRIKDPLTVFMDPDIEEADGSDSKFCILAIDVDRKEFEKTNPEWKGRVASTQLGGTTWAGSDKIRKAEYWRRVPVKDRLVSYMNPVTDQAVIGLESKIPRRIRKAVLDDPDTQTREVTDWKVECFTIIGDEIAEETPWLGIYIPVVRVIGEETVIDGVLDRKGHTRALKDGQRMFNYNASGSVEFGALQTKIPYLSPMEAIEDFEEMWKDANKTNRAFLPYNHRDEEGDEIPSPQRQQPPTGAPIYMEGMQSAAEWMRMVSGQYQADMGAPSNERSGKAITARQRQGDLATYHYLDHQSRAVRFTGKILIDLIPKIYDTRRMLKYKGDDGEENHIQIDPDAKQAVQEQQVDRDSKMTVFNPNIGKYDVESDVGPSYQTRRQDAFEAGVQILQQNESLTSLIGDLVLKNADFPGADEMAERMKRMVPPQALDPNADPQIVGLQQQIQQQDQVIKALAGKLSDKSGDLRVKQEKTAIEGYRAQTDRFAQIKQAASLDPQGLLVLVREVLEEMQATSAGGNVAGHVSEDIPATDGIHPDLGGSLAPPGSGEQ